MSSKTTSEQTSIPSATVFFDKWAQPEQYPNPLEMMMQINAISMKLCSEVARESLQMMTEVSQNYSEQIQDVSSAKGLDDMMRAHARLASKNGPQLFQRSQRLLETCVDSADEYKKCFEKAIDQSKKTSKN